MLFLRKIELRKWLTPDDTSWLKVGDIPADPIGDLATRANTLSIWHIEDDRSNLERVVTGHAAKLSNPRNFEYSLFGEEILTNLKLTFVQNKGDSLDDEVNERWHWEITDLSGNQLLQLAKSLLPLANGRDVVLRPAVEQLIVNAVSAKRIEFDRLNPTMKDKIKQLL